MTYPAPIPPMPSLQSWALNGKRFGQKRNATTNPAGTFAKLRVVTKEGVVWETIKRGEGCEALAVADAVEAGFP